MLQKISFSILSTLIYANESYRCEYEICENLGQENKIFRDTTLEDLLDKAESMAMERGVSNRFVLQLGLHRVNNYGCWCHSAETFYESTLLSASIDSKDEYDECCKAKHIGYDCIRMEAASKNEICEPTTTSYDVTMVKDVDGSFKLGCSDTIESNWCKRKTFMADLRFLITQDNLMMSGAEKDYAKYGHPGFNKGLGNFDLGTCKPAETLSAAVLNKQIEDREKKAMQKVCCGDYPYRVVFNLKNENSNACCAYKDDFINETLNLDLNIGHVYNTLSNQCCDSGVKSIADTC